jgi:hypothetical protein
MKVLDANNHFVKFKFHNGFITGEINCAAAPGSDCHHICADDDCYNPHNCAHAKVDEGSCVIAGTACLDFLGDAYAGHSRPVISGPIIILWDDDQDSFAWAYTEDTE